MVMALGLLLKTECSPLEGSVEYIVPDNSVLAPLLTQLEGLQDLWAQVDRSAMTPVTVWNNFKGSPCCALPGTATAHCFEISTWIAVRSTTCRSNYMQVDKSTKALILDHDDGCKA